MSGVSVGAAAAAAGCAALAVLLASRPVVRPAPGRRGRPRARLLTATVGTLLLAGLVGGLLPLRPVVLGLVGAGAALGLRLLLRRHRSRSARSALTGQVLESCELLSAELSAGRAATDALDLAARRWPLLLPAAEAQLLGLDVAPVLRRLALTPGAEDLRLLAAAWHVAHRSGHGLGAAVDRVVTRIRRQRQTGRVVESELASARATARLVAALPLAGLALGSGAGGAPWRFLLDTPVGLACLAAGLGLGVGGLLWIEAIADSVERP